MRTRLDQRSRPGRPTRVGRGASGGGGGGSSIEYLGAGTQATGGSPTPALLAGTEADDLAIAVGIAYDGSTTTAWSAITGWNKEAVTNTVGRKGHVHHQRVIQGGDGDPTFTHNFAYAGIRIFMWRGVTTFQNVATQTLSASTSPAYSTQVAPADGIMFYSIGCTFYTARLVVNDALGWTELDSVVASNAGQVKTFSKAVSASEVVTPPDVDMTTGYTTTVNWDHLS